MLAFQAPPAGLAGLCLLLAAAAVPAQKTYKDPRYGFQIRVPKDFREVPINMDEKWVIAKFLYKRPLEGKRVWAERTPELRVIVFPKVDVQQVVAARKKKEKKVARGKGGRTTIVNLFDYLQNPFKSYHEYLRENYKKGGWFVKQERNTKVGGMSAVFKTIEVEEKMGSGVKSTLFAWEIDYGDAIYVVQLDVLKDHDVKFLAGIKRTSSSFKKIPRTESLRPTLTAGADEREETKAERRAKKDLSPEERRKLREADLAKAVAKAKKGLPKGWKSFQDGPFTVIYSTTLRFAKRVSKQANLMWNWMHKNFAYVGDDYSVGGIIRVCRNSTEASSYADTSTRSGSGMTAREIVLWDDKDWGFNDSGSGRLNWRILNQYLLDKNWQLWWALPPWLDRGMDLYIGSLKLKGKKLVAKPDEWDMEAIRDSIRNDKFIGSRELLHKLYSNWTENTDRRVQCLAIVDYLMGKGARSKRYKGIVHDYVRYLDRRLRELRKARKEARKDLEKASEEEMKKWQAAWRKESDKIYEDCFQKVFGDWSDADWASFDAAWRRSYKR